MSADSFPPTPSWPSPLPRSGAEQGRTRLSIGRPSPVSASTHTESATDSRLRVPSVRSSTGNSSLLTGSGMTTLLRCAARHM